MSAEHPFIDELLRDEHDKFVALKDKLYAEGDPLVMGRLRDLQRSCPELPLAHCLIIELQDKLDAATSELAHYKQTYPEP